MYDDYQPYCTVCSKGKELLLCSNAVQRLPAAPRRRMVTLEKVFRRKKPLSDRLLDGIKDERNLQTALNKTGCQVSAAFAGKLISTGDRAVPELKKSSSMDRTGGGATTTTPHLSVDSNDGVLSAMPEDFADREDEEEEEDELQKSTQRRVLPDSQDLFITLTEIPSQPNKTGEGTSALNIPEAPNQRNTDKYPREGSIGKVSNGLDSVTQFQVVALSHCCK
ncbi:hypothetical protein UY3_11052 [Chelonia mydas]|uniref:Uncharacterized protein n=1 Tax=Chelonia mydas TaxID=8469 RepID=M7B460_CHEMY|nr:hypothetical protein UY3_11052 [Chelonia mydas]